MTKTFRPYKWRRSPLDYDRASILRALQRDLPNAGKHASSLRRLVEELQSGKLKLSRRPQ